MRRWSSAIVVLLAILFIGVSFFKHGGLKDLSTVDFTFYNGMLTRMQINGRALQNINWTGAHISYSSLRDTKFKDSLMNGVKLVETDLSHAEFTNTKLIAADFSSSDLNGAEFKNCDLTQAVFDGTNLRDVKVDALTKWPLTREESRQRGVDWAAP